VSEPKVEIFRETKVIRKERLRKLLGELPIAGPALRWLRRIIMLPVRTLDSREILVKDVPSYLENRPSKEKVNEDEAYLLLENAFRGTGVDISKRQKKYLPYIVEAFKVSGRGKDFLDVGCGRGEFLRLLKNSGIPAKGIEINTAIYEKLKSEGFDVELIDANEFLGRVEDASLSGLSAIQVAEHFTVDYLKKFLELASQKIGNGGVIILESVNPKCSFALANFYIDPTHAKPLPPELLSFLLERYGFIDLKILYSSPCHRAFRVKDCPEHNYMDYALIGRKI
jgi:SAM-dependent methyltransferase